MPHGKFNMCVDFRTVLESLGDVAGRLMVAAGIFLVIFAVLQFTPAYQWFSFASFLFGVFLIVTGIAVHFESFRVKVPSKEGWGTILMCLSVLCIAAAVTFLFYAEVGRAYIMPTSFRRGAEKLILIDLARPTAWLAPILFWTGIGFLVSGFVLKFSKEIF